MHNDILNISTFIHILSTFMQVFVVLPIVTEFHGIKISLSCSSVKMTTMRLNLTFFPGSGSSTLLPANCTLY